LGVSAIIAPLVVSQQLIRLDVPLMIGASALAWFFGLDQHYSWLEGLVFLTGLISYIVFLIYQGKRTDSGPEPSVGMDGPPSSEETKAPPKFIQNVALVVLGLGLLVLGSKWLVDGAVWIATLFGVSEIVIGLTIVAAGTSLPEVVTSIVATIKGERDIAVGNVVGSNLFNILGVLGLSSLVAPSGIDLTASFAGFDLPIMFVVAFACLPIFFSGGIISRWEGIVLFAYYVVYVVYLTMASTSHDALPLFSFTLLYFAIPLTLVTLVVIAWRSRKAKSPLSAT